jgi:hypothetical protein
MKLPCDICTAEMPPKGELVKISGLGSGGSLNRSWNMAWFVLQIWQKHKCWFWKEFIIGHCLGVLSGIPSQDSNT